MKERERNNMLCAGQDIILYGSGRRCVRIVPLLLRAHISIRAITDSMPEKWGTFINNIEIQAPSILKECSNTVLCITAADETGQEQIRTALRHEFGYDMAYEIRYDALAKEAVLLIQKAKIERCGFADSRKSHIVFDCISGLGLGGIEEWTKGLCTELIKNGFDNVHIFTDTGKYQINDILTPVVDQVLDRNSYPFKEDILERILDYLTELLPVTVVTGKPEYFIEAADLLKQIAPDKVRMISVMHGGEERLYKRYEKYAEHTDFFVAVSEDIKRDLLTRGVPKERIASITCPVVCGQKLERVYTTDTGKPVRIGYAGRIVVAQKRMDLMLKVIETLEAKKVSYIFEIAGDGSYKAELEEAVTANHWNDHIHFAGMMEREHIPEFWRRQDICVNTADAEGRSISQLEAMANGAVPVVTCTSGTREDICEGKNGYLAEIGDYERIADRIAYLAEHRELLPEFGRNAHDTVYPKCQKEIHTKFWIKLLGSIYGYH